MGGPKIQFLSLNGQRDWIDARYAQMIPDETHPDEEWLYRVRNRYILARKLPVEVDQDKSIAWLRVNGSPNQTTGFAEMDKDEVNAWLKVHAPNHPLYIFRRDYMEDEDTVNREKIGRELMVLSEAIHKAANAHRTLQDGKAIGILQHTQRQLANLIVMLQMDEDIV